MENGKCAVAKNLTNGIACGSTEFQVLRPNGIVLAEYLYRYLRQESYRNYAAQNMTGVVGQRRVPRQFLLDTEIPLPPLNEQRRIVSTIEQLTDRSHKARAALADVPKLIAQFHQSVLAAAFRGDLTADWREKNPDVEPASELLERIRVERKKCWEESLIAKGKNPQKSKYKEAEEITNQIRYELPETWSWMTLGDVAWPVKDGPHYSPQYSETGIPFITGGNVRAEGIDFENVKYISPELHKELSQRCLPEYGDVLYTKGGTTGIARVNTYENEFNVWVHVAVLKCVSSIERFYLQHALNSPWCYQQSQLFTHGTGNQDLGLTRMINILVPLAPKPEQIEIVRRVEIYMKAINTLCQEFDGYTEQIDLLDRSILAKAFRGELVPQDPNDEPAAVLLERIRAEREQTSTPKQRGKTTRKNSSKQLSIEGIE
jgi:type I restriction enzyme, S subunit